MEPLKRLTDGFAGLKLALVAGFGALLGIGAWFGALKGLLQGAVFCLLCSRKSAPATWRETPTLYIISELMLMGLGTVLLLGALYGWRELRGWREGRPPADPARTAPPPGRRAQHRPVLRNQGLGRPAKPSVWDGWLVHGLAALCLVATLGLGGVALNTRHNSSDLSFAVLLIWLLPLGTFFLGCLFLFLSPRPWVSRAGGTMLILMLVAGLLQKLLG